MFATLKKIFQVLTVALLTFALYQLLTWPSVAVLAKDNPSTTAFIEAHREREEKKAKVAWTVVPGRKISSHLKRAVLCGEDLEFFSHHGFSSFEIEQAMKDAQDGKKLRGASTLTQQLAKNLWLSPSRNPWRKVKEAILTWQLEQSLSKKRILELYCNVAEFGPGIFGAEAAARHYFGVAAADLSESQAAALAAGLPSPTRWNPATQSPAAQKRARTLRQRMDQATWLRQLVE